MGYISSEVNESYYMIGILVVGSILGMVQIISRGLWVALLVEMVVVEVPESSRRIVILGPRRRMQYPCCYSLYDFTTKCFCESYGLSRLRHPRCLKDNNLGLTTW